MRTLAAFLWVVLVGVAINSPIGDPDLWWHLTVGRWMLAHNTIPTADLWNAFSAPDVEWRAYSWPHEILYALVEQRGGVQALWWLQFGLAIMLVGTLSAAFARLARDGFIGVALGTVVAAACFQNFSLRPQTVVWMLFAWSLVAADSIARRERVMSSLLALVLLFCFWANSHITTIIGIAVVGLWIADSKRWGRAALACSAAIIGTLLTPYWGGEWLTFFSKTGHPLSMTSIAEFQPATLFQYGMGILVLMIGMIVAFLARGGSGVPAGAILGAFFLSVAGAAVVKFIPFAAVSVAAVLAVMWRNRGSLPRNGIVEGVLLLKSKYDWLPKPGFAFLLLCLLAVNIRREQHRPLNEQLTPSRAVDYIQANKLATPILGDFGRGGYLMYRFSNEAGEIAPEYKVAIDGRTNVNSPEIWSASRKAMTGAEGWDEILKLVSPKTILWRRESPFSQLLLARGGWTEVFASGTAEKGYAVFVKDQSVKEQIENAYKAQ